MFRLSIMADTLYFSRDETLSDKRDIPNLLFDPNYYHLFFVHEVHITNTKYKNTKNNDKLSEI
jgi:hypothetical protein